MCKNVYLISANVNGETIYKIGYTKRDVEVRINELKTGNPYDFNIIDVYKATKYGVSIENSLHKKFKDYKINGEWFDLSNEDIDKFSEYCEFYYNMYESLENNTYLHQRGITFK